MSLRLAPERYFERSPSDPMYRGACCPHDIHFVMVPAQMGGDGGAAIEAATKLDAAVPAELARQFPIMEPVKAATFTTQLQFADPDAVLALAAPDARLALVRTMHHCTGAEVTAKAILQASLVRVRNNGRALAGLAEVYRRKGDRNGEAAAGRSCGRASFGPSAGPDLSRL